MDHTIHVKGVEKDASLHGFSPLPSSPHMQASPYMQAGKRGDEFSARLPRGGIQKQKRGGSVK